MKKIVLGFCSVLILLTAVEIQNLYSQNKGSLKVLRSINVGGTGGWDYIAVNHNLNRIYTSHDTLVNIIELSTGNKIGIIPGTPGVHGIAFADKLGKGYTSNGKNNTLTVFDLKTNKILKQVSVGKNPDAIIYDDFSNKIITCNGKSNDATIVDPETDAVVATVPLGGKPETPVSNGAGTIYINIEDKNAVVVVDMKTFKAGKTWKLGKGEGPAGLAIDRKTNRLFSGCGDSKLLVVLNAANGKVVAELPIGEGSDGVGFDQELGYIYSSNREGTLSVIHEVNADKYEVLPAVQTKFGARTLVVDEVSHRVYLPTAEFSKAPENATKENPRKRPQAIPETFQILEIGQ